MQSHFEPGLYIVATPIGNLEDIGARAAALLAAADIVAVEDSRVTARLLRHLGLKKAMRRYNDHSAAADRASLVDAARAGVVALVSDAGTPLISDPGYKLVRAAREAGVEVRSIAGPSAAIAALSIVGLPTDRFLFAGFLPPKDKARAEIIAELGSVRATLIFYESGRRLDKTLAALASALGEREAAVARELTKRHEEVVTGSLSTLAERYAGEAHKGEIVILVSPPVVAVVATDDATVEAALIEALDRLPASKAAAEIATRFGRDRKTLYALATRLKAKR